MLLGDHALVKRGVRRVGAMDGGGVENVDEDDEEGGCVGWLP